MSDRWFINIRNLIIVTGGFILTYIFYVRYGDIIKPMVFVSVVLAFSILYSVLFGRKSILAVTSSKNYETDKEKIENINSIANRIKSIIKAIKSESGNNSKLLVVSRFMEEIEEFDKVIPGLVEDYKKGISFINENSYITQEIKIIEMKVLKAKGIAKETYETTLKDKHFTLGELEKIKSLLDENESRLHYILGTLQKIQVIIETDDLDNGVNCENMNDLNVHLETFSENLKNIIGSMKL